MSGARPDEDASVSGRLGRGIRPIWYALIALAAILVIAAVTGLPEMLKPRKIGGDNAGLVAGVGGSGEAWKAPTYPAPEPAAVVRPPPLAQVDTPRTGTQSGIPDVRMFQPVNQQQPAGAQQRGQQAADNADGGDSNSALGAMLKPTVSSGFRAQKLPHPWATIEDGRVIACTQVTRINSSVPGFVQARIPMDVYSADGSTVLLERGSTIKGEVARGLVNGLDRIFVLWQHVLTPPPHLVRIKLNSPAADGLGQAGLDGEINRHTWTKIGGALLLSGIQLTMQGLSQALGNAWNKSEGNNNSFNSLNFYSMQSQGSSLASRLLEHTINIPDTLERNQAQNCSIFVNGDLSFEGVYSLRRR